VDHDISVPTRGAVECRDTPGKPTRIGPHKERDGILKDMRTGYATSCCVVAN
jgi:hypothetical protein